MENAALIEQHWSILGPQRCSSARGSQEPAAPEYVKQRDSSLPPSLFSKPLSSTMSVSMAQKPTNTFHQTPLRSQMLPQETQKSVPFFTAPHSTSVPHLGPGVIPPQPTISQPVRTTPFATPFESSVCHHIDKIDHPEVSSKLGTFGSLKRMGEILVFCARSSDTLPMFLCPGIVGKQMALQLKALNSQLWKLHQELAPPTAFTNKLCLGAALMAWGGGDSDTAWTLGEQDFQTFAPAELDRYKPSPDWTVEPKKPKSVSLENWRRNALNQSLVFALLYGHDSASELPHLAPRKAAIENLYQLNLGNPNKYTLKFITDTWSSLNARWVVSLRENVNRLRLLRKVERPTFEELKETGMPLDPQGCNIYTLPDTFGLSNPGGYFQVQILGSLERDFERSRWDMYYRAANIAPTRNAGGPSDPPSDVCGPSLTTKERRACALAAPKTAKGLVICWGHNSHLGCTKAPCFRRDNGGKVMFRNYETICPSLKLYLTRRGGLKDTKGFRWKKFRTPSTKFALLRRKNKMIK